MDGKSDLHLWNEVKIKKITLLAYNMTEKEPVYMLISDNFFSRLKIAVTWESMVKKECVMHFTTGLSKFSGLKHWLKQDSFAALSSVPGLSNYILWVSEKNERMDEQHKGE